MPFSAKSHARSSATPVPSAPGVRGGRNRVIVWVGVATVALVAIGIWAIASRSTAPDPASSDPVELAKYVATDDFEKLPPDQKRPYMKRVRQTMKQITDARREDRITKQQYRAAYVCAWMERKLDDMDAYYAIPAARRAAAVDKELRSKQKKSAGPTKPDDSEKLLYDDPEGRQKFEEMKDDFEDDYVDALPPELRQHWEQYRQDYKSRRDALETTRAKRPGVSPP